MDIARRALDAEARAEVFRLRHAVARLEAEKRSLEVALEEAERHRETLVLEKYALLADLRALKQYSPWYGRTLSTPDLDETIRRLSGVGKDG